MPAYVLAPLARDLGTTWRETVMKKAVATSLYSVP
jgi:hypothetical protein